MQVIVLMGRAGSGKSTVGRLLASQLGWQYISTGDVARKHVGGMWQELGMPAPEKEFRKALISEFESLLSSGIDGIVLDGLPRKPEQVWFLEEVLATEPMYYIIEVSEDVARQRLYERGRADDTKTAIEKRLAHYQVNRKKIRAAIKSPVVEISAEDYEPQEIANIIAARIH